MNNLRLAKVIAIHPESYQVDLIMLDDGAEVSGVPVMTGEASTRSGVTDLNDVAVSANGKMDFDDKKDSIAIVGVVGSLPVVIGFLHPSTSQMLFKEKERMVYRHPSDVYITIDPAGNTEVYHPSGTYFRIGETAAHEDLTGKDHKGNWKVDRNTGSMPYCKLVVANGGTEQASLEMTPTGDINIIAQKDVNQAIVGNVTQTIGGFVAANVTGNVDITTPKATVHGDVDATGSVNLNLDGTPNSIVTVASVCSFTGAPHTEGSLTCKAGGG